MYNQAPFGRIDLVSVFQIRTKSSLLKRKKVCSAKCSESKPQSSIFS